MNSLDIGLLFTSLFDDYFFENIRRDIIPLGIMSLLIYTLLNH